MKNLKHFIDQENRMAELFDKPQMDVNNLTVEDANALFCIIDLRLSPEWLYRDGEATRAEARRTAKYLNAAAKELKSLGFKVPANVYELQ